MGVTTWVPLELTYVVNAFTTLPEPKSCIMNAMTCLFAPFLPGMSMRCSRARQTIHQKEMAESMIEQQRPTAQSARIRLSKLPGPTVADAMVGDALHYIKEVAAGRLHLDALVAFPTCTYVCKYARVWRRRKRMEYCNGRRVAFATIRLLLQNPQLDALGVKAPA